MNSRTVRIKTDADIVSNCFNSGNAIVIICQHIIEDLRFEFRHGLAMRALVKDLHEWQKRYIDHLSISNNMYFYNYKYFKVERYQIIAQ